MLQGFKGEQYDVPHGAKLLGEGGSATIYQETLFGELRATKYPKKVCVTTTASVNGSYSEPITFRKSRMVQVPLLFRLP